MKQTLIIVFALLMVSFTKREETKTAKADKTVSSITYSMHHPMHSWKGVSKQADVAIEYNATTLHISKVSVDVPVKSFDSENASRDKKMLSFTEATKYPVITFVSNGIVYAGNGLTVNGLISFHGVSKPISFTATEQNFNKHKTVTGSFTLLLEDFKIERPSLLTIKTDNAFELSFVMGFVVE
jgi:polyisoprenoid-binding protein YceI